MKQQFDIMDLYAMPSSYNFTADEIKYIKSKIKKHTYKVHYAIYKMDSKYNAYIGLLFDSSPNATRRSGILNQWEIIISRDLSNEEYNEIIRNYGMNNRRFKIFMYDNIELLQYEDNKYGIKTPQKFIDICLSKGYSGGVQTKIEFAL